MALLHFLSPVGFRATGVRAGIKKSGKPDVGMLVCDSLANAAAAFTTSKVISPAVKVGRVHVAGGKLRAVIVNSGNANACTGRQGERDAVSMCAQTAKLLGCDRGQVLPSSTGIIGQMLPMEKISAGISAAAESLGNSQEHSRAFMSAILTTDLKSKEAAVAVRVGKETIRLAGVCKGSGMIGPRVSTAGPHATMLAYLTCDVAAPAAVLRKLLQQSVDVSFNCVTVDDHASTNDTVCLLASGMGGAKLNSRGAIEKFSAALNEVSQSLAYQIAADGEGATKVVKILVKGARTVADARALARTIANSPLVKCAMNGNDPNWGRIVSAAGYAEAAFDPDRCMLRLQGTVVFKAGQPVKFDAGKVSKALRAAEVVAELDCKMGKADATVWTCDLSKEYVTINADYHT